MHIIQMAQEQHAIYFGYAFFRRFRLILQELVFLLNYFFIPRSYVEIEFTSPADFT